MLNQLRKIDQDRSVNYFKREIWLLIQTKMFISKSKFY